MIKMIQKSDKYIYLIVNNCIGLMKLFNIHVKYCILLIVYLCFKCFAWITSPIYSLFVDKTGNLPKFLKWFQTSDSNMFGVDGDRGFARENEKYLDNYIGRWFVSTKWGWRNTGQGFSTYVLGIDDSGMNIIEKYWLDSHGQEHEKRIAYRDYSTNYPVGFEYKGGYKWCLLKNYYFRWRIGWKFRFGESRGYKLPAPFVFSISPFKKID